MKSSPINFNLNKGGQGVHFTGVRAPGIEDLRAIDRFTQCGLDGLKNRLIESIEQKSPGLAQRFGEYKYIPDETVFGKIKDAFMAYVDMHISVLDGIAKRFPNSKLNNSQFMEKYRRDVELNREIKAVQGIQKNALEMIQEHFPNKEYPVGNCDDKCRKACDSIKDGFNKNLNRSMRDDVGAYDTRRERYVTRLVSGITGATFLGSDYYNNAIDSGATKEEAIQKQNKKQYQEIRENFYEATAQFGLISCLSEQANKYMWVPAALGAVVGVGARILSRKKSGMLLGRVQVPDDVKQAVPTIKEYKTSVTQGKVDNVIKEKTKKQKQKPEKEKEAVLCKKNLILICLGSVVFGYLLRFLKGKTAPGQEIEKMLKAREQAFNSKTIKDVYAKKGDLEQLANILSNSGNYKLAQQIRDDMRNIPKGENALKLGTDYETMKLFNKIEVKKKDILALPTAPLRFAKELVSYPYKMVSKLESAIRTTVFKEPKVDDSPIEDIYQIKNIYKRFMEFKEKYQGDDRKLADEFSAYVKKMYLVSNDRVTSSKGDNSKIAVIAQTLGTLLGMKFNMDDEFNNSIANGKTKKQAEKDARLRGINKFCRMTVQLIVAGTLNSMFSKQYNSSILKSTAVVFTSTIITDTLSRLMTGMPFVKKSKEELDAYKDKHQKGIMKHYYNAIDKLAS